MPDAEAEDRGESIALAIPFHSGRELLALALASVLAQDDPAWTLVVVDDSGGDEGARAAVEACADGRVRYLSHPHEPGETNAMVSNWNRCLAAAGGELVALLHADDLLAPAYVRTVRALARAHPRAVAFFTASRTIDARGRALRSLQDDIKRIFVPAGRGPIELRGEPGLRALLRGNFIVCPTLCFRTRVLAARRFESRWRQVQDLALTARLLLDGDELVGSREKAYAYRRHDASATARQTQSLLRFHEEYALFDEIARAAEARDWTRAARTARRKGIVRLHLGWRAVSGLARGDLATAADCFSFLLGRPARAHGEQGE